MIKTPVRQPIVVHYTLDSEKLENKFQRATGLQASNLGTKITNRGRPHPVRGGGGPRK
jgi:hypothetical protein